MDSSERRGADRRRLQRLDRLNIPPSQSAFNRSIPTGSIAGRVLLVQSLGFIAMIAVAWIEEFADWSRSTPSISSSNVNVPDATVETIVIIGFWIAMVISVGKLLHHIRYLEGLLPVCSFCKSIRLERQWVPLEHYMHEHSSLRLTHSVCPSCARRHYQHEEDPEVASAEDSTS